MSPESELFDTATGEAVYTPSDLNREARLHLEAGFGLLWLEGEVSNLAQPASGHRYFSLKDDRAQVRCAMFRSAVQRTSVRLENGQQVRARGRVSLYEPRGDFQFIAESLQAAGEGELQRRFEELKKKLLAEGLFAPERKRQLPRYPLRIGIITSPSGAVIRDIHHVLARRWPIAQTRLYASAVQGTDAVPQLLAALQDANREAWAQVLILARGGGSLEDLQAFNDESLARAVAVSGIPLISAVGHETDTSISDFVADLRAPTPSAAAELATPDGKQLLEELVYYRLRLSRLATQRLQLNHQGLDHLRHRLEQRHPRTQLAHQRLQLQQSRNRLLRAIQQRMTLLEARQLALQRRIRVQHPGKRVQHYRQQLQNLGPDLLAGMAKNLHQRRSQLQLCARTLHAVSPLATLQRGYSVLFDEATRKPVTQARQLRVRQPIVAQLLDGRAYCEVLQISDERLAQAASDSGADTQPGSTKS